MRKGTTTPFDTLESAHDFVRVLEQTLAESKTEISADIAREPSSDKNRRLDALRIAEYNLERLDFHLRKSSRLLNDLRTVRRLLFEERNAKASLTTKPQQVTHTAATPRNGHPVAAA